MRAVLVLVLLVATAHADPARCSVAGTDLTLQEITVAVPGEESFKLGIQSVPAVAHLPRRCGAPIDLDIGGSLVFSASRDMVWMTVTRDITTPDGLVTLKRGAQVIDACMRGDRVFATAILENEDTLEGEHKPADQALHDVELPCDALSLDRIDLDENDYHLFGPQTEHQWELRGDAMKIRLYSSPKATSASRLVESPHCGSCIKLGEVKRTKDWVLVEVAGFGVMAQGWVKRSLVKQLPDEEANIYGGIGCYGDHGGGGFGESPDPRTVEREGTVRIGTPVYLGEGTGMWGLFAREEHVKVRFIPGEQWYELRRVPGLDGDPSGAPWLHGNVRADTVTLDQTP